jgi:hypothetical protein
MIREIAATMADALDADRAAERCGLDHGHGGCVCYRGLDHAGAHRCVCGAEWVAE